MFNAHIHTLRQYLCQCALLNRLKNTHLASSLRTQTFLINTKFPAVLHITERSSEMNSFKQRFTGPKLVRILYAHFNFYPFSPIKNDCAMTWNAHFQILRLFWVHGPADDLNEGITMVVGQCWCLGTCNREWEITGGLESVQKVGHA